MVVVYADDSGTHDEQGEQPGSREGIVGGIAALREDWIPFCNQWQAALKKYGASYFHFREWRTAFAVARKARTPPSDFKTNPYRSLNEQQLRRFLTELATVAGAGNKLIIGGSVFTQKFHKLKIEGEVPHDSSPYEHCLAQFFASFLGQLELQRKPWKRQRVSFFFDRSDNKRWIRTVNDVFLEYQKGHQKWEMPVFRDKKQSPYLPLQAADMVAYRLRYITERWVDNDSLGQWPELDEALFKPAFDFLDVHKEEVLRAFYSGKLDYEHYERH
ncbi:MAG: DUF3800 domain-containing protein [Verrucomicrobiia bacterium]